MTGAEGGQSHHSIWSMVLIPIIARCSEMGDLLRAANLTTGATASHVHIQALDSKSNGIIMLKHSEGVDVRKPVMNLSSQAFLGGPWRSHGKAGGKGKCGNV